MDTSITNLISYPVESAGEPTFEELYRHYFIRLFRFCFSIVHVKEPAEEIVNDVFLNLWKKMERTAPGGDQIGNLDLYLYVSVKNHSLNYLRSNHSLPTIEISERCDQYIRFDSNPETLMLGSETLERIRAAINQLPPRCRLIFTLIKEDGLKYKHVACLLSLSVKTVEAQLAIALRKIAASLGR